MKLHTPRVQEKMRQKNLYDYPVVILSDEGSEFSKQFEDFLRVHGIKKRTTESYTPQPNVEATCCEICFVRSSSRAAPYIGNII